MLQSRESMQILSFEISRYEFEKMGQHYVQYNLLKGIGYWMNISSSQPENVQNTTLKLQLYILYSNIK